MGDRTRTLFGAAASRCTDRSRNSPDAAADVPAGELDISLFVGLRTPFTGHMGREVVVRVFRLSCWMPWDSRRRIQAEKPHSIAGLSSQGDPIARLLGLVHSSKSP